MALIEKQGIAFNNQIDNLFAMYSTLGNHLQAPVPKAPNPALDWRRDSFLGQSPSERAAVINASEAAFRRRQEEEKENLENNGLATALGGGPGNQ